MFDARSRFLILMGTALLAIDSWAFRLSTSETLKNSVPSIYNVFAEMNTVGFVLSFIGLSLIFIGLFKRYAFSLLLAAIITVTIVLLHI